MYVVGVDVGGTKTAVMLAKYRDKDGNVEFLERRQEATSHHWETTLERIADTAAAMLKKYPDAKETEKIGGISCGGPLSSDRKYILSPPNLPGWDQVPITEYLGTRLEMPFYMENDADACALAEWKYGAGTGTENMIFLTFGTGLGAGLILNGKLYRGSGGMAGEIGHIRMRPDGPIGYGKKGSLEGFCSGGGISRLAEGKGLHVSTKELADMAQKGDQTALEIFRESGRVFGEGLAILVDLLNPEVIVAGSVYARCRQLLEPYMRESLERESLLPSRQGCRILPAGLGEKIGDYGAVMAAITGWQER